MTHTLSIIVPLYNEEENLAPLHEGLVEELSMLGLPYEIILVDDGSEDDTVAEAVHLARLDPQIRLVKLRRNYGQTAAMAAGIEHARGDVVITMDGDLQTDPADIALMLEQIDAGYDIVVGWRYERQDDLLSRTLPSRMANWLIAKVIGIPLHDTGCPLKAFRTSLIKQIPLYAEMHRFIPAMASIAGARITEIKVRHHPRRFGESKYGLSRIYKVVLDLLVIKTVTAFTSRPLRWFVLLSLPMLILSAIAFTHTALSFASPRHAISLPIAGSGLIFFFSALIFICNGALGELAYKIGDVREHRFSKLTQSLIR